MRLLKASPSLLVPIILLVALLLGCAPPVEEETASGPDAEPQTAEVEAQTAEVEPCLASAEWITNPNPPEEIGNDPDPSTQTNCEFFQFSWQWFLDQIQPVGEVGELKFETLPILTSTVKQQCESGELASGTLSEGLFVRTGKDDDSVFSPVFPENIAQAGSDEVLYAQQTVNDVNVVFYNVRFNETECDVTGGEFAPGTMEIKTAWRPITAEQADRYYAVDATINLSEGGELELLLGLVGMHLVRNTATHPEFVWATFEHRDNVPDCASPQPAPAGGWSFTSAECAACLAASTPEACSSSGQCKNLNQGTKPVAGSNNLSGDPNEICREFPDGIDPSNDPTPTNNAKTLANIDALNDQIHGFLAALPDGDPRKIWVHYFNVGGLWTNEGTASSPMTNQRGSLALASSVMESFVQDAPTNCFSCHVYDPSKPLAVSHIYE